MTSTPGQLSRALLGLLLSPGLGVSAATVTFTNATPIVIPAPGSGTGNPSGAPASLYPSPINVGGVSGTVTGVGVRLLNFTHSAPGDVDVLLVGPNGANILLLSDVGGTNPASKVTLTFSPGAVAAVPSPVTSGTYRPTNNGANDAFPPPAPTPSAITTLDVFNGSNPNGAWNLFVVDDAQNNTGLIEAWELILDTTQAPFVTAQPQSRAVGIGTTVDFFVNAVGAPPLSYQWHVNCRNIHNGTNSTLTISNVGPADLGNYSVTISNAFGEVTSWDASLAITNTPGPLIRSALAGPNLLLNWPLREVPYRLEELAQIKPPPLGWNPSDADVSFTSNRLAAQIETTQAQKFFRVAAPNVKILTSPTGKAVRPGDDVILSVIATGAPPLMFQWRLNGQAIPDQTNATLAFMVKDSANLGAYQVAVLDATGDAVLSRPAVLRFDGVETLLSDSFAGRPQFFTLTDSIHGNTFGATSETGEPRHAGVAGGRSVWLNWKSPGNGIATFDTIGSGFDTLLAAYTGQGFAALFPIAGDDDSGGNLCSKMQFNVSDGADYNIAIDGVAGADGFYVLNWSFTALPPDATLPVIDVQPQDQIIQSNQTTSFFVVAHGVGQSSNVAYQWYFNGVAIPESFGGTNSTLKIGGPQPSFPAQIGEYYVDVDNKVFTVRSRVASLQFSTDPQFHFVPKLEADLLCGSSSADATNCCGGSFKELANATPKLLSAASGTLAGSLTGGGSGSASRTYWVWVTNGFTCSKSVKLTANVKVGGTAKGCTLELYSLAGIVPLKSSGGASPRSFSYTFAADTLYVIGIGYDVSSPTITLDYTSSVICP
jgi:subtilisin-like proprotein convertase family protein